MVVPNSSLLVILWYGLKLLRGWAWWLLFLAIVKPFLQSTTSFLLLDSGIKRKRVTGKAGKRVSLLPTLAHCTCSTAYVHQVARKAHSLGGGCGLPQCQHRMEGQKEAGMGVTGMGGQGHSPYCQPGLCPSMGKLLLSPPWLLALGLSPSPSPRVLPTASTSCSQNKPPGGDKS